MRCRCRSCRKAIGFQHTENPSYYEALYRNQQEQRRREEQERLNPTPKPKTTTFVVTITEVNNESAG